MRMQSSRPFRFVCAVACTLFLVAAMMPVTSLGVTALSSPDVYVSDTGSDLTGTGSEAAPYRTITKALTLVSSPGTIHIGPGLYHDGETFPISVPGGVTLESTHGRTSTSIYGDGAESVIEMRYAKTGTAIRGLTITNGYNGSVGGGVLIYADSAPTVDPGWPQVIECDIVDNTAGVLGGGLYAAADTAAHQISPWIEDVHFTGNAATNAEQGRGGGMCGAAFCTPTVYRCEFDNNWSGFYGGNLCVWDAGGGYYSCDFDGGHAQRGGSVAFLGIGNPVLERCTITGGHATGGTTPGGGGIEIEKGSGIAYVRRCIIDGNQSDRNGGGIWIPLMQEARFESCLIKENTAVNDGGAMFLNIDPLDGTLLLQSCTVVYNQAGITGDGIEIIEPDPSNHSVAVTVTNCIFRHRQKVAGNDSSVQDLYLMEPSDDVVSYSLFRNNTWTGTGVLTGSPSFVSDATTGGDFHLRKGSQAIDSGADLGGPYRDLDYEIRPLDGNGSGTAEYDMGCYEHAPFETERLGGATRYETACEVASRAFNAPRTIVVASGDGFADALSAAGLAGVYGSPVLLVKRASVPSAVFDFINDPGVHKVVIVGGEAVVGPAVVATFEGWGCEVQRIAGADRYETSAEVAREMNRLLGDRASWEALVARGDNYPDALAVGPLAYAHKSPVLLVRPTSLPPAIADAMWHTTVKRVLIAGGPSAVSGDVYEAIEAVPSVQDVERISGADRYQTAALLAEEGMIRGWCKANYVGIATGTNFPDALAGGATAGGRGGVLLLCKPTSLTSSSTLFLTSHKGLVVRADVYGGEAAVSSGVRNAVDTALGW